MTVKKYRIILLCVIILVIIATLITVFYKTSTDEKTKQAVFRTKEDKPFKMVEVYTFNLPPADQQMLQEGIMIADDAKLESIIEDYES